MATIHPKPKLLTLRDDGDGGLDIIITTSRQEFEVLPLTEATAGAMAARIADWMARRAREREAIGK